MFAWGNWRPIYVEYSYTVVAKVAVVPYRFVILLSDLCLLARKERRHLQTLNNSVIYR